ncbi:MAG TPA: hypothetical protein VGV38_10495 [Pyrinomonadaceae bacterium]|nr:hypothetical protein [Pyrinomonadaceae bacterium]
MSSDRTTEILNYLSAISREVGLLRAETSDRFNRLEARFDRLETRFDRFQAETNARFDLLEAEVREGRTEVRMITSRLDRIEAKALENKADIRDIGFRVAALEGTEP